MTGFDEFVRGMTCIRRLIPFEAIRNRETNKGTSSLLVSPDEQRKDIVCGPLTLGRIAVNYRIQDHGKGYHSFRLVVVSMLLGLAVRREKPDQRKQGVNAELMTVSATPQGLSRV